DWSPDGTRLAYGAPADKVVVAHADGSDPQVVTSGADPAWSPDGTKLAVVDQGGIWMVAPDGKGRTHIIESGRAPGWSPGGRQLVYDRGEYGMDIWLANADGTEQHMLAGVFGDQSPKPSWSPDGAEIAFVSLVCGNNYDTVGICTIPPGGGREQALRSGVPP